MQIRVTPLIRKIIAEIVETQLQLGHYQVNVAQKFSIEHQLIACKLLQLLINNTIDNAAELIEAARNYNNHFD